MTEIELRQVCRAYPKPSTPTPRWPPWWPRALAAAGLPPEAVQVISTTDRAAVGRLITMTEYVDVIVPRGGKS